MMKFYKVSWTIAFAMIILHLLLDYTFFTKSAESIILFVDGFVQVFMTALVACLIASFVAAVPFRNLKYSSKFLFVMPYAVILLAGINLLFLSRHII
ncbi:hypothetical protein [Pontibacter roseus]|uniref:hypothetical protein n=1 Tax=Pontibacter roseus TaxID=336989 RepID=UPI00037804AF|nr:hypothetical protein [Pontibacter roseus]